jgi:hypothetical protein
MSLIIKIKNRLTRYFLLSWHQLCSRNGKKIFSPQEIEAIAKYRKGIKIYDAFIFFNELETLEIRLNILEPYVDFFVIVECTKTFSGKSKPLYFKENASRFSKFSSKIVHFVIDDAPEGDNFWEREIYQRESIKKSLARAQADDFCFVSDVDEIWNPDIIIDYRKGVIYKFVQKMYVYYLNNRSSEKWAGTFAAKYAVIKDRSLNDMRNAAKTSYTYIKNGGWHFTNQGGADSIRVKLESYSHSEFNTPEIKSKIEKQIIENRDFVGRKFKFWIDETDLPIYIKNNKEIYSKFFK